MDTLDKISEILKERKISQSELCSFLGVKKNAYTNWKSGHTASYKKYLPQIAEFLDVSVDYLLGRTDTPGKTAASVDAPNPNQEKLADLYNVLGGFDDDQLQLMLDYAKFLDKSGK